MIRDSIKFVYVQCIDPSGQVRFLKFDQFPIHLGTHFHQRNQLRDPQLEKLAFEIIETEQGLQVKMIQSGIDFILGDLKLQSMMIPMKTAIKIADTELTFSWSEFKSELIEFPRGEQPWHTQSESGIELVRAVKQAAQTKLSIYLFGETGTGKEVLAKLIHVWSDRASGPFVPINCAALSLNLVESELFGHTKGSFTGAMRDRPGALLHAHGGTLFLDEVGDLPVEIQVKLLRFLESGEIRPVGSDRNLHADVRIICATHKPLAKMVKEGTFRQDLFFRLASIPIEIPSLRSRLDDIEALSIIFSKKFDKMITQEALIRLKAYSWPGNVRELRHAVERACGAVGPFAPSLGAGAFDFLIENATEENLSQNSSTADMVLPGVYNLKEMEKVLLLRALKISKGNRTDAAKILGIARSTLFEMLKRYKVAGPKAPDYWLEPVRV